jgi:hypothetical protein
MARKPRIHFAGAVYHVMLRGNGGREIFFSAADRTKMFFLLQEGVERYGHCIHAFCLMSNHVHLVMHFFRLIIYVAEFRGCHIRHLPCCPMLAGMIFQKACLLP